MIPRFNLYSQGVGSVLHMSRTFGVQKNTKEHGSGTYSTDIGKSFVPFCTAGAVDPSPGWVLGMMAASVVIYLMFVDVC